MAPITSDRKSKIDMLASGINKEYTEEEIYYLVSLLSKKRLLIEKAVPRGGYRTSPDVCPYCGKPL